MYHVIDQSTLACASDHARRQEAVEAADRWRRESLGRGDSHAYVVRDFYTGGRLNQEIVYRTKPVP